MDDTEINEDLPDRPDSKFDLSFVLLRQVDRVNIAFSIGNEQVLTAVNALESSLIGYINKSKGYREKLDALEEDYKKVLDASNRTQWADATKKKASFDFAQKKFTLLMEIIYTYIIGREKGGIIGKPGPTANETD